MEAPAPPHTEKAAHDLPQAQPTFTPTATPSPDRILLRLLQLFGLLALAALALVPTRFLPSEDAVILFEYSRNLAQHGAVSFLAGGPHVEGATDFGWMLLLAAAERCGIPPFPFCAAVNVLSLFALAAVLARIAGLHLTLGRALAVAGAAALFRQIFAAALGFSVLPNALLLAILTLCTLRRRPLPAALAAVALCLFRPDGVVFALPLLAYLLVTSPPRARTATVITAGFLVPGLLYFLWRWHYFGELLPLPFLVKSDFHRDLGLLIGGSVRASFVPLLYTAVALTPVFLFLPARRRTNARRTNALLALALLGLPTLFYWTVRLDQNVGSRFFSYLPAGTAILLAANWQALVNAHRSSLAFRTALAAWALLFAAPQYRELLTFRSMQFSNVQAIATGLSQLPQQGLLLTSEAGFLPFYSRWPTIDSWGLNTPEFAHRFFQPADVARIHADLIVLHPDLSESCLPQPGWPAAYPDRSWPHMTRNLVTGATAHYDLWLTSYGSEFYRARKHWRYGEGDRECWFVRKDSSLKGAIEAVLAANHAVPPAQSLQLEQQHTPIVRD